jgi:MYXO-CTERM domain-containing protein
MPWSFARRVGSLSRGVCFGLLSLIATAGAARAAVVIDAFDSPVPATVISSGSADASFSESNVANLALGTGRSIFFGVGDGAPAGAAVTVTRTDGYLDVAGVNGARARVLLEYFSVASPLDLSQNTRVSVDLSVLDAQPTTPGGTVLESLLLVTLNNGATLAAGQIVTQPGPQTLNFLLPADLGPGDPSPDYTQVQRLRLILATPGEGHLRLTNFVAQPIPEPAAVGLLAAGTLLLRRRRAA